MYIAFVANWTFEVLYIATYNINSNAYVQERFAKRLN